MRTRRVRVYRNEGLLSAEEAADIRRRSLAYERAREAFDPKRFKRGGGYSPADVAAIEAQAGASKPTNKELGALELYEFMTQKPAAVFVYINEKTNKATTWTGDVLGEVTFGTEFRTPAFGWPSVRQAVRVHGVNGVEYAGTYFKSSGDYARLKAVKSKRKR